LARRLGRPRRGARRFASKHLEELNAAREADSLLPEEMDCGVWTGERVGSNMVFGNAGILHSNWDDSFTELRQLVLMEHGFIYLGMAGAAVTVLLDDRGVPEALPGVAGAMTDGCCFLAASADVRSKARRPPHEPPLPPPARAQTRGIDRRRAGADGAWCGGPGAADAARRAGAGDPECTAAAARHGEEVHGLAARREPGRAHVLAGELQEGEGQGLGLGR